MSSPLIDRLSMELGWPLLDNVEAAEGWLAGPGTRCLFITGDPAKNLETADAAVILPELVRAFGGAFVAGVAGQGIERAMRERFEIWPTPSFVFVRDGETLGAIPKIRDWDDYMERTRLILSGRATEAA